MFTKRKKKDVHIDYQSLGCLVTKNVLLNNHTSAEMIPGYRFRFDKISRQYDIKCYHVGEQ